MIVAIRLKARGTLREKYTTMKELLPLPLSVDQLIDLELQTEKKLLRPILSTRSLINNLRKKGHIVYISDMYLPDTFIRQQLTDHGFFLPGDTLYVSDTIGAYKSDGSLFKYVRDKEHLSFSHWHHYGDNRHSDYRIPRRLGIKAHHLHYDYLPYEHQWINNVVSTTYPYPSLMAGLSRAVRLSIPTIEDQSRFVADISAPSITTWVASIMADAKRRGISHLYFCARDCHSYYLAARSLAPAIGGIKVHYLFNSRRSLMPGTPYLIDYLVQEGVASHSHKVALVDTLSKGNILRSVNRTLCQHGYPEVAMFYATNSTWSLQEKEEQYLTTTPDQRLTDNLHSQYLFCGEHLSSIYCSPITARLTFTRHYFEVLFSLNYHLQTVGYAPRGNTIRPLLAKDPTESWHFTGYTNRQTKNSNDRLIIAFAEGMQTLHLLPYSQQLLDRVAIPTFAHFLHQPPRPYLDYLHRFHKDGLVWVDKRWRKNIFWTHGSNVYTFSPTVLRLINAMRRLYARLK